MLRYALTLALCASCTSLADETIEHPVDAAPLEVAAAPGPKFPKNAGQLRAMTGTNFDALHLYLGSDPSGSNDRIGVDDLVDGAPPNSAPMDHQVTSSFGLGKVATTATESVQIMQAEPHVAGPAVNQAFAVMWIGAVSELGSSGFFEPVRRAYGPGWGLHIDADELRFQVTDNIVLNRARLTAAPIGQQVSLLAVYRPAADTMSIYTNFGEVTASGLTVSTLDPLASTRMSLHNSPDNPETSTAPWPGAGANAEFALLAYWQDPGVEAFTQATLDLFLAEAGL